MMAYSAHCMCISWHCLTREAPIILFYKNTLVLESKSKGWPFSFLDAKTDTFFLSEIKEGTHAAMPCLCPNYHHLAVELVRHQPEKNTKLKLKSIKGRRESNKEIIQLTEDSWEATVVLHYYFGVGMLPCFYCKHFCRFFYFFPFLKV